MKICCAMVAVFLLIGVRSSAQTKKIKKEVQTEYIPDRQGKLQRDTTETIKLYDKKGNVVEEREKSFWPMANKIVLYSKKHLYNARGRLDSTLTFVDGKFALKLEPHYDSASREIMVQEINSERKPSFLGRNIYSNNAKQKSRVEMYNSEGKLYNFKNYKYDKKGNMVDESGSEGGEPRYHWLYKYDEKNRLTEREDYSGQGILLRKHKYEYNKDGRVSQETVFDAQGQLERVTKYSYEYY